MKPSPTIKKAHKRLHQQHIGRKCPLPKDFIISSCIGVEYQGRPEQIRFQLLDPIDMDMAQSVVDFHHLFSLQKHELIELVGINDQSTVSGLVGAANLAINNDENIRLRFEKMLRSKGIIVYTQP